MKKFISLLAALCLATTSYADCSFKDLVKNPDGTVVYSAADHICVGQLKQDNAARTQQAADLNKAITLKDLTITKDEQRIQNWSDTSMKLEENIQKIDTLKQQNEWIYFGLGVLATFLAASAASNLARKP
jgi:hypothetical protein